MNFTQVDFNAPAAALETLSVLCDSLADAEQMSLVFSVRQLCKNHRCPESELTFSSLTDG